MWTIYLHKNKINGKVYVGQTKCKDPNQRWRNGTHYKNTLFGKAIEKYGWENFEHIILRNNILTQEEADLEEKKYIKLYKSTERDFGYNLTSGGVNYECTEEIKKQRSEIMKKRWEDEEYRKNTQEKLKKYWENNLERKQSIGQTVQCIETQDVFQSYEEAAAWCGLKNGKNSFLMYFRGERQSCGKHPETKIPLHWIKLDKDNNIIQGKQNLKIGKNKNQKQVQCINTGDIFDSLQDAINWCGLKNTSSITNMIKGRKKSAGKHPVTKEPLIWKYI